MFPSLSLCSHIVLCACSLPRGLAGHLALACESCLSLKMVPPPPLPPAGREFSAPLFLKVSCRLVFSHCCISAVLDILVRVSISLFVHFRFFSSYLCCVLAGSDCTIALRALYSSSVSFHPSTPCSLRQLCPASETSQTWRVFYFSHEGNILDWLIRELPVEIGIVYGMPYRQDGLLT